MTATDVRFPDGDFTPAPGRGSLGRMLSAQSGTELPDRLVVIAVHDVSLAEVLRKDRTCLDLDGMDRVRRALRPLERRANERVHPSRVSDRSWSAWVTKRSQVSSSRSSATSRLCARRDRKV